MRERFFDITDSDFGKQKREYFDYHDIVSELVREFAKELNFETTECAWLGDIFFINPTTKDLDNFSGQLKKQNDRGMRAFKMNSQIGKLWKKKLEEKNIPIGRMSEPRPQMFDIWKVCKYGESHYSKTLRYKDRFYWSISGTNDEKLDENMGYIEILGSEFYRISELLEVQG